MKLKCEIDIGDLWVNGEAAVRTIVEEEIKKVIRAEVKSQLRAKQGRLEEMTAEMFDKVVKKKR